MRRSSLFLILSVLLMSCSATSDNASNSSAGGGEAAITSSIFGSMPDGRDAMLFRLTSPSGMMMEVTNYGGIITRWTAPNRDGTYDDVVLGYDNLDGYLKENPYFGAIIGRYGNRIGAGRFELDGETYTLATNNDANHLHGGIVGFDKVLWGAEPFTEGETVGIVFTYTSPNGEEGYPGNLSVMVTYRMSPDNKVEFTYEAMTDKATPVNLTQHSYFNLAGTSSDSILDHELMIMADHFTPIDSGLIPTGVLQPVVGTPFDFTTATAISSHIDADDEQIAFGLGYDHNWVLRDGSEEMKLAARMYEPTSGRIMEVHTHEPGIQFYAGNFLDGTITGKSGAVYEYRSGFCLETQHFPDSPNKPEFPTTILRPGETYSTMTTFSFLTDGMGS